MKTAIDLLDSLVSALKAKGKTRSATRISAGYFKKDKSVDIPFVTDTLAEIISEQDPVLTPKEIAHLELDERLEELSKMDAKLSECIPEELPTDPQRRRDFVLTLGALCLRELEQISS